MKKLLTITTLLVLASCGKSQPLKTGGKLIEGFVNSPREIARHVLGIEDQKETDLTEVNNRLDQLEQEIASIQNALTSFEQLIDDVEQDQDALQQTIALTQSRLAVLESNHNVTELIDPCGDYPGHFDEMILKTSTGKFLAYYQQGNFRFLTELPNGNYQTTDKQKCDFTINNGQLND